MAEGDSKRVKKTLKIRGQGGGDDVAASCFKGIDDRLSHLPDNILHHILSSLDTRSLVRTSILSRRWRCIWKEVPVLNFSCDYLGSKHHVLKFLSSRSTDDSAPVSSLNFKVSTFVSRKDMRPLYKDMLDRVMKYAASCGGPRPRRSLHHLSMRNSHDERFRFVDLVPSIKAHQHHQSLKTLYLKSFALRLDGGGGGVSGATLLFSGFNLLTNLELDNCSLFSCVPRGVVFEPFIGIPCLKHLKLVGCFLRPSCLLKVPELLDLQIQSRVDSDAEFEVFAPKLKSFCFWGCLEQLIQLDLPSLDHANIRVRIKQQQQQQQQQEIEATNRACLKLFPQLHNVESLNLQFDKTRKSRARWEQHGFPLISSTELFAELEVSPFTRLKDLRVWYPYKPPTVPYQVIRYFLEGSPHAVRKSFEFQTKPK